MDRTEISHIAHADHPVAAPVSESRLERIVTSLAPFGTVLDLGCGAGMWLLRALAAHPGAHGVGIDLRLPPGVQQAAQRLGVSDRVRWIEGDAGTWTGGEFDVVFTVGATHAFGGLEETLRAVRSHLRPGGQVVLGDGIWEGEPTQEALAALDATPQDFPHLAGFVERIVQQDFEVVHGHVSTLEEWDDYEWSWTGSLIRWALAQPRASAQHIQALEAARDHRHAWLSGYRQQLGFATLVLVDVAATA